MVEGSSGATATTESAVEMQKCVGLWNCFKLFCHLHTHIFFECVTFSVYKKQEERGKKIKLEELNILKMC